MWKFQDFLATQILREISLGHFEAPKTAILTILSTLHLEFLEMFDIFKCEIPKPLNSKPLKLFKLQF